MRRRRLLALLALAAAAARRRRHRRVRPGVRAGAFAPGAPPMPPTPFTPATSSSRRRPRPTSLRSYRVVPASNWLAHAVRTGAAVLGAAALLAALRPFAWAPSGSAPSRSSAPRHSVVDHRSSSCSRRPPPRRPASSRLARPRRDVAATRCARRVRPRSLDMRPVSPLEAVAVIPTSCRSNRFWAPVSASTHSDSIPPFRRRAPRPLADGAGLPPGARVRRRRRDVLLLERGAPRRPLGRPRGLAPRSVDRSELELRATTVPGAPTPWSFPGSTTTACSGCATSGAP